MNGQVHVAAGDIIDIGGEGQFLGLPEGADAVGLQAVWIPDSQNGTGRNFNGRGL
jgi:hypothetical protein